MKRKLAISVLFLILLASCTTAKTIVPTEEANSEDPEIAASMTYLVDDIDIGDGGLLSDQPCSSPCVFGINIAETPLDQVILVLENNGISRCWTEPNLSWSLISCGGSRLHVQVDMGTRLVNAIWFDPSVPISLGDILEKYGEPNYVTLDRETPGAIHPRFYWNSLRMLVSLPEIPGETYEVNETTQVEAVDFSDEKLYRTAERESDPYYKPWKGYGIYQPPAETTPALPMSTATMSP